MSDHPAIYQFGMHFDAAAGGADRYFNGLLGGLREIGTDCTGFRFWFFCNFDLRCGSRDREHVSPATAAAPFSPPVARALERPDAVIATHFALYATALQPALRRKAHVAISMALGNGIGSGGTEQNRRHCQAAGRTKCLPICA